MNEPNEDLCKYEMSLLRQCAADDLPPIIIGAGLHAALEVLRGRGFIDCEYTITPAGRDRLAARP